MSEASAKNPPRSREVQQTSQDLPKVAPSNSEWTTQIGFPPRTAGLQDHAVDILQSSDNSRPLELSNMESSVERSETLLMQLTDRIEPGKQHHIDQSAQKIVYFGNDSVWFHALHKRIGTHQPMSRDQQCRLSFSPAVKTHFSIPDRKANGVNDTSNSTSNKDSSDRELLQQRGAFLLPPIDVQQALLTAYFRWVHPVQRVLDQEQFMHSYHSGCMSTLLLHSIFMVATTCCDENIITAHWNSRRSAQLCFFTRAKMLYDADQEPDRIAIIQSLFLMSFWWGSPLDQKDCGHWLGAAVTFAQAHGMHRSYVRTVHQIDMSLPHSRTKHSSMCRRERSLWKRIWWAIYVSPLDVGVVRVLIILDPRPIRRSLYG